MAVEVAWRPGRIIPRWAAEGARWQAVARHADAILAANRAAWPDHQAVEAGEAGAIIRHKWAGGVALAGVQRICLIVRELETSATARTPCSDGGDGTRDLTFSRAAPAKPWLSSMSTSTCLHNRPDSSKCGSTEASPPSISSFMTVGGAAAPNASQPARGNQELPRIQPGSMVRTSTILYST